MIRRFLLFLIRFYQRAISPHLGRWCRFHPSCSEYARQAILFHGVGWGLWLAAKRVCRCHPFCQGGWDPVPLSPDRFDGDVTHRVTANHEAEQMLETPHDRLEMETCCSSGTKVSSTTLIPSKKSPTTNHKLRTDRFSTF